MSDVETQKSELEEVDDLENEAVDTFNTTTTRDVPVPFERRHKGTDDETQILEELNNVISAEEDQEPVPFRRELPRSNRHSVLAAGNLQRTKNMLHMFENMNKKSNSTQQLPPPREFRKKVEMLTPQPVNSFSSSSDSKIKENRPSPIPRRQVMNNNIDEELHVLSSTVDAKPIDFTNPDVVAELKLFLENSEEDKTRELLKEFINSEKIGPLIVKELITRKHFIPMIKKAAADEGIDATELSFALLE